MSIAGVYPEQGVRVALTLVSVDEAQARYEGDAFTPTSRHPLALAIDVASGAAVLQLGPSAARDDGVVAAPNVEPTRALGEPEGAFVRQVGKQLWRLATQTPGELGGGRWPRRVQRWRGPKG